MESHMRSVPEVAEEATLAEQAPSFEEFYGANFPGTSSQPFVS
jgi:hypothetical protein